MSALRHRTRLMLLFLTAVSAASFVFFIFSTIRRLVEPRSCFITSDSYSFSYRTYAIEHNTRYNNGRETIDWNLLGFHFDMFRLALYAPGPRQGNDTPIEWGPVAMWRVAVPGWACIAVSAILPTRWVVVFLRRRREAKIRAGICLRCGYDLRASPARCPECGEERPRA